MSEKWLRLSGTTGAVNDRPEALNMDTVTDISFGEFEGGHAVQLTFVNNNSLTLNAGDAALVRTWLDTYARQEG